MLERPGEPLPLGRLPRARLAGRPGRQARQGPVRRVGAASAVDSSLTDNGSWVMTMFTQYGPPNPDAWTRGRDRYADACVERLARYAPNVPNAVLAGRSSPLPDLERIFGLVDGSIFQGRQGLDQMAFMRPSPAAGSTTRLRSTACTSAGRALIRGVA